MVSSTVRNTGSRSGATVAQLYVAYPAAANQPLRQLRGFQKVAIEAGGEAHVSFELRRRDVSYWDVMAQDWAVASGEYTIYVGTNSRDLGQSVTVSI